MDAGKHHIHVQWFPRLAVLVLVLIVPFALSAETVIERFNNIEVTATVQGQPPIPTPTTVIFKGIAYPQSQVTLEKDGGIIATVPADPSARFQIEITNVTAGTYTFSIFAEDSAGRVGRTSNFTISVTQGTTTTVAGIFLGPTIQSESSYKLGDTVTILGATAPYSQVTVIVTSDVEQSYKTDAGSDGAWVLQVIADTIGAGTHSARAKAVSPTFDISGYSNTVSFSITQATPKPCDGKRPGDINCDGKVNLSDFSILLYFWKKTNPSNQRADINKDGVVNIRDLSILLFYWTK